MLFLVSTYAVILFKALFENQNMTLSVFLYLEDPSVIILPFFFLILHQITFSSKHSNINFIENGVKS